MKCQEEIEAAYRTILDAMDKLPEKDFTPDEICRIEGAADALNWALNNDELASIFETNLKAFRHALSPEKPEWIICGPENNDGGL